MEFIVTLLIPPLVAIGIHLLEGRRRIMSLYIKTEDYRKYGINKYSNLASIREMVQKELNIETLFVSFVNKNEYIRVDFLKPRSSRRSRRPRVQPDRRPDKQA